MTPFENLSGHRYLVIARVGDQSMHGQWLEPASERNYDLCLSYYGDEPGRFAADCDYYFEGKGAKWSKISGILALYGDRIWQYDAVWFPDDDIQTNAFNINRMFQLFTEQKLLLAQPALKKNAHYQVTAQNIDYQLRYTQFVDTRVALFSREALQACWGTFNKNLTGWGLEFVWGKLLNYPDMKIAILDATPVIHSRPAGQGDLFSNMKAIHDIDVDFYREMNMLAEYGAAPTEGNSFYGGINKWNLPIVPFSNHSLSKRKRKLLKKRLNQKKLLKKLSLKKLKAKKINKLAKVYKTVVKQMKKPRVQRKPVLKKSA